MEQQQHREEQRRHPVDPNVLLSWSMFCEAPSKPGELFLRDAVITPAELDYLQTEIRQTRRHKPDTLRFHPTVSFGTSNNDDDDNATNKKNDDEHDEAWSTFVGTQSRLETIVIDSEGVDVPFPTLNGFEPLLRSLGHLPQQQQQQCSAAGFHNLTIRCFRVLGKKMGQLLGSIYNNNNQQKRTHVLLDECELDLEFLQGLASVSKPPTCLTFFDCDLTDEMVAIMARYCAWVTLTGLDLSWNLQLTPACLPHLASLLSNQVQSSLVQFTVTNCRDMLSPDIAAWAPLGEALKGLNAMKELKLGTSLNAHFIPRFVSLGTMPSLKKLDLGGSRIFAGLAVPATTSGRRQNDTDDDFDPAKNVRMFSEWLTTVLGLEELILSGCDVTNDIVLQLFKWLERNKTIQRLVMDGNRFSVCGWEERLPRLSHQLHSMTLAVQTSTTNAKLWTKLEHALSRNSSLTEFVINNVRSSWQSRTNEIVRRNQGIGVARKALRTASLCNQAGMWPHLLFHLLLTSTRYHDNDVSAGHMFFLGAASQGRLVVRGVDKASSC